MRDDKVLYNFANKISTEFWNEVNSRRKKRFVYVIVIDGCDVVMTDAGCSNA